MQPYDRPNIGEYKRSGRITYNPPITPSTPPPTVPWENKNDDADVVYDPTDSGNTYTPPTPPWGYNLMNKWNKPTTQRGNDDAQSGAGNTAYNPPYDPMNKWNKPTTGGTGQNNTWEAPSVHNPVYDELMQKLSDLGIDPNAQAPTTGGTGQNTEPEPEPSDTDLFNMLFGDWQSLNNQYAISPDEILSIMESMPSMGAVNEAELQRNMVNELRDLIKSKGESGLIPVAQQFANVKSEAIQVSSEQYQAALGDLNSRHALESGAAREAVLQKDRDLNKNLITAKLQLETEHSRQAFENYNKALDRYQSMTEAAARGELDWFNAMVNLEAIGVQSAQEWAKMSLSERMQAQGFDLEKYKTDMNASLEKQRISLEERLGLDKIQLEGRELNLRELMAENDWDIKKTQQQLDKYLAERGFDENERDRELSRWSDLLQAEVTNRRTDIDYINAMGQLDRNEWEKETAQAELELKRWLGEEQFNIQRDQMGADWAKFVESQALQKWLARGNWDTQKWITATYAGAQDSGGGSWFGDVLGFAGTIGAAWIAFSSRQFKDVKSALSNLEEDEVLKSLIDTPIYHWKYTHPALVDGKDHVGLVTESSPTAMVTLDGKAIDIIDTMGYLVAAVKALTRKVEVLQHG